MVAGGTVKTSLALGAVDVDSNDAVVAADGRGFVVAFAESRGPPERVQGPSPDGMGPPPTMRTPRPIGRRLRVARVGSAPLALQTLESMQLGDENWPFDLIWDGCEHVLAAQTGARSEAIGLWLFP